MWIYESTIPFLRTLVVFSALFFTSSVFSGDWIHNDPPDSETISSDPQFVSIGGHCHVALDLRGVELRKAAYPFDWMYSNDVDGLVKCLDEDFLNFAEENDVLAWQKGPYIRYCNPYNMTFIHDSVDPEYFEEFMSKYERRIHRFRKLRTHPGKVFFIRNHYSCSLHGENGEFNNHTMHARKIKATLDRYFPDLNFLLVILTYNDLGIPLMEHIDGVVELRYDRSPLVMRSMLMNLCN